MSHGRRRGEGVRKRGRKRRGPEEGEERRRESRPGVKD
jgi:hypothetical protein